MPAKKTNSASLRQSGAPAVTPEQLLAAALKLMPEGDPRRVVLAELVQPVNLPERLYAALPADDPRFRGLRAFLAPLRARGSQSPIPAILGEFARSGFEQFVAYSNGYSQAARPEGAEVRGLEVAQEAAQRRARIDQATSGLDFE